MNYYDYSEHERKDLIKWIVTAVLFVLIITALIVVIVKVVNNEKTTTLRYTAYEIGTLNDEGDNAGEFAKSTESIVTKDFITVKGLTVELKEDANVQYRVFYYAKDKDTGKMSFISATELMSADLTTNAIPESAQFVKIVIIPTRDSEVTNGEIRGYANQVVVTHSK